MSDSPSKSPMLTDGLKAFKEPVSPLNSSISGRNPLNVSPLSTQPPRTILNPSKGCKTFAEPASPLNRTVSGGIQLDDSPQPTQPSSKLNKTVTPVKKNAQGAPVIQVTQVKDRSSEVKVEPHFDKLTNQCRAGMIVEVAGFAKLATSPTSMNGTSTSKNLPCKLDIGANGQQRVKTPTTVSPLNVSQDKCSTPQRKPQQRQISSGNYTFLYLIF